MNKSQLNDIIENDFVLSDSDTKEIENLLQTHPYFRFGHLLLLKNKFDNKEDDFDNYLMKTANYSKDRTLLYDFLHENIKVNTNKTGDKAEVKSNKTTEAKTVDVKKSKSDLQKEISDRIKEISSTKTTKAKEKVKSKPKNKTPELDSNKIGEKDKKTKVEAKKIADNKEKTFEKQQINNASDSKKDSFDKEKVIDTFLKNNPKINKPGDDNYNETERQAKESLKENMSFISETLAQIYAKQGNKKKAKQIYEQLMLKNPEKKLYFAGQIKKLGSNK